MPITPGILAKIHSVLAESAQEPDSIMLWAACCKYFFGFLHLGEITAPSVSHYDPSAHLTVKDVQINSRENPTVVKVLIKASKTDPFRKGMSIFLGRTDNCLYPVAAITAYLASHGPDPGPLFRFSGAVTLLVMHLLGV